MTDEAPPTTAGSSSSSNILPSVTTTTSRGPRTLPATQDLISRLGSQTLLDLAAAWIDAPLKEVGQLSIGLTSYPTGQDSCSDASCKTQSYTSWDVSSRSYVASLSIPAGNAFHARRRQLPPEDLPPDNPTDAEVQALTAAQRSQYAQNKIAFFRGVGWKTQKQRQNEAFRAQVLRARRVPEAAQARGRRHAGAAQPIPQQVQAQPQQDLQPEQQQQPADQQPQAQALVVEHVVVREDPLIVADVRNPGNIPVLQPPYNAPPQPQRQPGARNLHALPDHPAWHSDSMPVRSISSTTLKSKLELSMPIPWSSLCNSNAQRLTDATSSGAMGSITRGPNFRDGSSMIALTKSIRASTGSVMEITPIVKLYCMVLSLNKSLYKTEVTPKRVVRCVKSLNYIGREIQPRLGAIQVRCVAVALDTYTKFMINKSPQICPDAFQYGEADHQWTAVPVDNRIITSNGIWAYLASYLPSTLWSGSVNHVFGGTVGPAATADFQQYNCRLLPSANSVYIPGFWDILLVMVDYSASDIPANITIRGHDIVTFRRDPLAVDALTQLGQVFENWWSNENINNIEVDCHSAIDHIATRLAVENAQAIASSIAAEMYLTQIHGFRLRANYAEPTYMWDGEALGAWSFYRGDTLSRDSRIRTDFWDIDVNDNNHIAGRRRLVGYNFSAISSWCRPPTGFVLLHPSESLIQENGIAYGWAGVEPAHHTPHYTITTMDSITRVATYVGLIDTTEFKINFTSPEAIASWHHMLSMATAAQFANIFASSNISLSEWTGYNVQREEQTILGLLDNAITVATLDIAHYINLQDLIDTWAAWDENQIFEYFGLDPFLDVHWMITHPLPYHYVQQWMNKIKYSAGNTALKSSIFYHNRNNHYGLQMDWESLNMRAKLACSIDAERYLPMVVYRPENEGYQHNDAWLEQWSYLSISCSDGGQMATNKAYIQSEYLLLPLKNLTITHSVPLYAYVLNSHYSRTGYVDRPLSISDLTWPDPPSWQDFKDFGNKYIMPALKSVPQAAGAALLGALTGGTPAAVIAGGTTLAKELLNNYGVGTDTKSKLGKIIDDTATSASKNFTVEPHTPTTHLGDPAYTPQMVEALKEVSNVNDHSSSLQPMSTDQKLQNI